MANKANKRTAESVAREKQKKQQKKERKAAKAQAEQDRQFRMKRRKQFYSVGIGIAAFALLLSLFSGALYGKTIYAWIQIFIYVLMGVCGFLTLAASFFEETQKRTGWMQTLGVIFILISIGMIISQVRQFLL